jgi:phage major head subunit gpT-like protein
MLVNQETLAVAFKGFNTVFTDAYMSAPAHAEKIAMKVPSSGATETYGWLGSFPAMREWIGPRQIKNLEAHGFVIKNRKFEATLAVGREAYSDDKLGLFGPMFAEMGQGARRHPEELTFGLLKAVFDTECYDEKKFFDAAHPVTDAAGKVQTVSNLQEGTGPAWFLLDTSRALRPLILQVRDGYEFQEIAAGNASHVFMNDEYLYGVRARVNAGFGLWQLAFG